MTTPISPVSSGSSQSPAFAVGQLLDEYTLGNYVSTQKADASQPIRELSLIHISEPTRPY